jgi:hypothetical protein
LAIVLFVLFLLAIVLSVLLLLAIVLSVLLLLAIVLSGLLLLAIVLYVLLLLAIVFFVFLLAIVLSVLILGIVLSVLLLLAIVLSVLLLLAIVLSVLLRFTDSDYPFGVFKLFLHMMQRILNTLFDFIWSFVTQTILKFMMAIVVSNVKIIVVMFWSRHENAKKLFSESKYPFLRISQ